MFLKRAALIAIERARLQLIAHILMSRKKTSNLNIIVAYNLAMETNREIMLSNTSEADTSYGPTQAGSVKRSPNEVPVVEPVITLTKDILEWNM